MTPGSPVTQILAELSAGDRSAAGRLLPVVYEELRALAANLFRHQPNQTLQPTALVHEAYLKMMGGAAPCWSDRKHFMAVAAIAMRQLLADRAKHAATLKRGGDLCRVTLSEAATPVSVDSDVDLIMLDNALSKLSKLHERQGRIVELRYLAGLSVDETADVLGVSPRTVKLDWQMARSFLRREMGEG